MDYLRICSLRNLMNSNDETEKSINFHRFRRSHGWFTASVESGSKHRILWSEKFPSTWFVHLAAHIIEKTEKKQKVLLQTQNDTKEKISVHDNKDLCKSKHNFSAQRLNSPRVASLTKSKLHFSRKNESYFSPFALLPRFISKSSSFSLNGFRICSDSHGEFSILRSSLQFNKLFKNIFLHL